MEFHPLSSTVTSRMQAGVNTTEAVVAKERYPLFAELPFAFLTASFMLVARAGVESCLSLLTVGTTVNAKLDFVILSAN